MKQKKNLMILLLIAVIGIVGVTIAYFSSRATFENVFETPEYGTEYIEKFTSPTNWKPGDVTEKTLEVKNSGSVDEAVRVKVEESWVSKRGTTLPLTQGDNIAALINFINEDDWTKVTVDGENYYYYYYNYKLAPEETTSKLLDKVTFNPLINASTTCTDSTGENGETIRSCTSNGNGYDGATYTLKFTIETVQYDKYQEAWNIDVAIAEEKPNPLTIQDLLTTKTNPATITNYTDGNIHEMYAFDHAVTAQTPALTDYRYIGDDPYNYIYFNCDDMSNQSASTCEVWRILGVFDVEREIDDEENPGEKKTITEQRIKIVRGSSLPNGMAWNTTGHNDWTLDNATLKVFLNGDYYNKSGSAEANGLKESARGIIDEAKYYLGCSLAYGGNVESIYEIERNNKLCASCGNDSSKLSWIGKIGLMYPSDQYYSYAKNVNSVCFNKPFECKSNLQKSWIYISNVREGQTSLYNTWFLNPQESSYSSYDVFTMYMQGDLYGNAYPSFNNGSVRPALYLSSNIKITEGTGESTNPYKLGL